MPIFNPKAFKAIRNQVNNKKFKSIEIANEGSKIIDKIVASPFVNTRLKSSHDVYDEVLKKIITQEYYINREFSCVENHYGKIAQDLSLSGFRVFALILLVLDRDCNYVYLPAEVVCTYYSTNRNEAVKGFNELIQRKVIIRSNRKSFYVVNHHIIFKGSISEFEKLYNNIFNPDNEYIEDNRIYLPEFNVKKEQERLKKVLAEYSSLEYGINETVDANVN